REVADDPLDRLGQLAHQRGDGKNLVSASELRVPQQVDHLDAVRSLEMLLADSPQVREGGDALRGLAGDVEAKLPLGVAACRSLLRGSFAAHRRPSFPGRSRAV